MSGSESECVRASGGCDCHDELVALRKQVRVLVKEVRRLRGQDNGKSGVVVTEGSISVDGPEEDGGSGVVGEAGGSGLAGEAVVLGPVEEGGMVQGHDNSSSWADDEGDSAGDAEETGVVRDEGERGWKVATDRGSRKVFRKVGLTPVATRNRFEALAECSGEELEGTDKVGKDGGGDKESEGGGDKESEVIVVGSSRVRYLDRAFCERNPDKRLRICYPGARVRDVADRLDDVLAGSSEGCIVIVHVGVNDVGDGRSVETVEQYRRLLQRLVWQRCRGVVTGILPKLRAGQVWLSRALGINGHIRDMCEEFGFMYLDMWDSFMGKEDMYALDGIHLSRKGVKEVATVYEEVVQFLN